MNNSKTGSRADVFTIQKSDDCRHSHRGVPIEEKVEMRNGKGKKIERSVIPKDVQYETLRCPECGVALEYDNIGDVVCPMCGVMNPEHSDRAKLDFSPSSREKHDKRGNAESA
jgi:rubrerythrin